jgi:hypothetical protein
MCLPAGGPYLYPLPLQTETMVADAARDIARAVSSDYISTAHVQLFKVARSAVEVARAKTTPKGRQP